MKKLDVPVVFQDKESTDCSLAALSMISKYLNLGLDYDTLKQENLLYSDGLAYAPFLGLKLLKKGFHVEIITAHQSLFSKKVFNAKKELIISSIKKFMESATEKNKEVAKGFLDFINEGGKLTVEIPSIKKAKELIDNSIPFFAAATVRSFNVEKAKISPHAIVVTGYDENYIYCNDSQLYYSDFMKSLFLQYIQPLL